MWGPSTGAADPIFPGDLLVITVRVSAVDSPQNLATFFCSSLSFHSGIAHFSRMQKFVASFVGAPFNCGSLTTASDLILRVCATDLQKTKKVHANFHLFSRASLFEI